MDVLKSQLTSGSTQWYDQGYSNGITNISVVTIVQWYDQSYSNGMTNISVVTTVQWYDVYNN